MLSSRFIKWFIIELIAVGLIALYVLLDSSDVYRWWVGDTLVVQANAGCDLHVNGCEAILNDGTLLRFEIEPKTIPLMKPLHFKVTTLKDSPSIELKLFATNMNMGLHTFTLKQTSKGVFEGEGMLPTCIMGNMIWQATVVLNQAQKSEGATFIFHTD